MNISTLINSSQSLDEEEAQSAWSLGFDIIPAPNGCSDNLCKVYLCGSNLNVENVKRLLIPCQNCTNTENITDCRKLPELSNQNLDGYLRSKNNIVSDVVSKSEELLKVMLGIAKGLNYFHEKNIAYRNIQPINIKIFEHKCPDKITAKLGGLQYCVDLKHDASNDPIDYDHGGKSSEAIKNKSFMAPECFKSSKYLELCEFERVRNKQTDIFALGVLFYYTLTSQCHPFAPIPDQNNFEKTSEKIRCGKIYPTNENKPKFLKLRELNMLSKVQKVTIADMIWHMINRDPSKRLEVKNVLSHPSFYNVEKKLKYLLTVHKNTKDISIDMFKIYLKMEKIQVKISKEKDIKKSFTNKLDSINTSRGEKCNELEAISAQELRRKIQIHTKKKKINLIKKA